LIINGSLLNDLVLVTANTVDVVGSRSVNYQNIESITVNGRKGDDTFVVDTTISRNQDGTTSPATSSPIKQMEFDGGLGNDTMYFLGMLSTIQTTINGNEGNDTINVGDHSPTTILYGDPIAPSLYTLPSYLSHNTNTVAKVQGQLTIAGGTNQDGSPGYDTLNVYDSGDTAGRSGSLTATALTGLGMGAGIATYGSLEMMNIFLGLGGNIFNVLATASGTATFVNLGTPASNLVSNVINIGSLAPLTGGVVDNIQGPLTVVGAGADIMNVDDTGNTTKKKTATLTSTTLIGQGMTLVAPESGIAYFGPSVGFAKTTAATPTLSGITYLASTSGAAGFAYLNINLGVGGNTLNVQSTHANTATYISGGAGGTDTFNVGSTVTSTETISAAIPGNQTSTLTGIAGPLTIDGLASGGSHTLNVDDTGVTAAQNGTLTNTQLIGLDLATPDTSITYKNLQALNLALGNFGNTLLVQSTHSDALATTATQIIGGTGDDIFNVAANPTPSTTPGLSTAPTGNLGLTTVVNTTTGNATTNAVQTITLSGLPVAANPTTFTLSLGGQTTGAIPSTAAAAQVQTALQALSTIGTGNVSVTGGNGGPYTVTFQNALGLRSVSRLVATDPTPISSNTNGTLDTIQAPLTLIGNGGTDALNVNDHGATGAFNYTVTPTSVQNNASSYQNSLLSPYTGAGTGPLPFITPPARTFAGITYNAIGASPQSSAQNSIKTLRLDATEQTNIFTVSPSQVTTYTINGFGPTGGLPVTGQIPQNVPPNLGDYLQLDTTHLALNQTTNGLMPTGGRELHMQTTSPTSPGTGTGFWSFTDGSQNVNFTSMERYNHVAVVAIAADSSSSVVPILRVYDAETGELRYTLNSPALYESWLRGGVRVAVGDVNGDGIPDLVTVPGSGHSPEVRIFNGTPDINGNYAAAQIGDFLAYPSNFTTGSYVAVGDVNGDGYNDIVTGNGATSIPQIKVFDGTKVTGTTLSTPAPALIGTAFSPFPATYHGAIAVAAGDINNDGYADIVAATASTGTPTTVNVFNGKQFVAGNANFGLVASFQPFGAAFIYGAFPAVGDFNGDGIRDIIIGDGPSTSGTSLVNVFSGTNFFSGSVPLALPSTYTFQPYPSSFHGGARVAAQVVDGGNPGAVEMVGVFSAAGPGAGTNNQPVRLATLTPLSTIQLIDEVFKDSDFLGGTMIG
jgi:hypothetical protein